MGRKELNPADVYRKQQRKKDLKKCKENRNVVRSVQELLSDPAKIEEEIVKAQKASDASALDKGLKDRIKELKMMKSVAITKQRIDVASGKTDRDAAAKLREAEMLQRDLNRERRRGLLADDHPTRKNDEAQKDDQGGTSSSYYQSQEIDTSKGATGVTSVAQQQVYHQLPVPMGIAPSMLPANSLPVQSTSFRPAPPPPRPPVFSLHSPPAYPDTRNGEQTVPLTTLTAMPVPPPPPRPFLQNLATIHIKNVSEEGYHPESNTLPTECEDSSHLEDELVQPAQIEAPSSSAAFLFPLSLTDFKLPSAEELMKRRHALVNDTEAVTVEFDGIDASASFPSYPQPHTLIEEQPEDNQQVISATEETEDTEEVFKINPIRVHSIYIPPTVPVLVPVCAISGLGGLAGYGSDSDQDDDDVGSNSSSAQKQENILIASDVPRFIPQKFTAMPSKYDADSLNPVPAPARATQSLPPTSSTHTNQNQNQLAATASTAPPAVSVSDDVNAFLESIASSEMDPTSSSRIRISQPSIAVAEKKPPLKPALKSVKLDAALTAFLPSALRVKRPAATQAGRPMAKVASLSAPSAVPGASNSNSKETAMIGGVEDAYLNFLEEIGELTG